MANILDFIEKKISVVFGSTNNSKKFASKRLLNKACDKNCDKNIIQSASQNSKKIKCNCKKELKGNMAIITKCYCGCDDENFFKERNIKNGKQKTKPKSKVQPKRAKAPRQQTATKS